MTPDDGKTTAEVLQKTEAANAPLDDGEPTEEEIRSSVRRSMQQAFSGQTRPADTALEEIRRELAAYADARQDD